MGLEDMPGLNLRNHDGRCALCVKWRYHFPLHRVVVKCQVVSSSGWPRLLPHCFSGRGQWLLLSGELSDQLALLEPDVTLAL